ncbi:MAG: T9SS type A sorting domain-containing protein, partial [Calditrichaeota bacterium]|nr:T9SS type A sorting domain-containing protein [Calditrichota bacterium]
FVFDRLSDGSHHVWTLSEPYGAKYWWPCKDTPIDKADSVDIVVTVPENQIVASNGTLVSDIFNGDGSRTFHWQEKYPIATYLVSLAIAPYAHFTDTYNLSDSKEMLLDYYVYPQRETLAKSIFPMIKDHLDGLISYFGDYPFPDEKYGMAQFGWGGGMEHQTISSIGVVSESWEFVYVHELAHQWFGDALSCESWQEIWLNEGFASYAEALYAEWAGYDSWAPGPDAYNAYINSQRYTGPGKLIVEDTTSVSNIFAPIVYEKGSWILHMLRFVLGDSNFFEALKMYASDPDLRFASVTTEDFKNVCERISGYDLDKFFDQWLNFPYFPKYSYSMQPAEGNSVRASEVTVTILQEQLEPIYAMPVELQFVFDAGRDTIITVYNNLREQQYNFVLNDVPVQVIFDPDNHILRDAADRSAGSYSKIKIENIYPNPANKDVTIRLRSWNQGWHEMLIFDISGKEINRLQPYYSTTTHEYLFNWNRTNFSGDKVASGVYIFKTFFNSQQVGQPGKVVLIK